MIEFAQTISSFWAAMDDAAHRDAKGNEIGWWKHLGLAIIGRNPDTHDLPPKIAQALKNVQKIVAQFDKESGTSAKKLYPEAGGQGGGASSGNSGAGAAMCYVCADDPIIHVDASEAFPMGAAQDLQDQGLDVRIDGGSMTDPAGKGRRRTDPNPTSQWNW